MTDVHARIRAFLQQQTVHALHRPTQAAPYFNKAGVVPFLGEGDTRRFLVMKPVPRHAHLPPPAFQICKGTRMYKLAGTWHDARDGEPAEGESETLAETAIREGAEELGLTLEGIHALYDMGPYNFSSSKSTSPRQMWLFTARLTDEAALLPISDLAETTAERRWMTMAEFEAQGREDHKPILAALAAKLERAGV